MIVVCSTADLKKGMATVIRAVSTRSMMQILTNICLIADAEEGTLTLSATDLEIGIRYCVPATIEEGGAITLPARLLNDIVSNLASETVSIDLDFLAVKATIRGGKSVSTIRGMDASDFPIIPSIPIDAKRFLFPVPSLRQAVEQVAFAASSDDSRPSMKGIFIELTRNDEEDGVLAEFTTADGYRLATRGFVIQEYPRERDLPFSNLLAPARAFMELVRIIRDEDGVVSVFSDGSHMVCESGRITLSSRIINDQFPDFRKIIPKEWDTQVVVDKQEIGRAVKISSFFAASNQNFVRLDLRVERGEIEITSNASEIGNTAGTVQATGAGKDGVIALNVAYFTEALKAISTEQVVIEINDPKRPFVLTEANGGGYKHLIMPMTLR